MLSTPRSRGALLLGGGARADLLCYVMLWSHAHGEGGLAWRKRDFLWVIPRLMAWKLRAVRRVEAEYAVGGPRGQRCVAEFATFACCDFLKYK